MAPLASAKPWAQGYLDGPAREQLHKSIETGAGQLIRQNAQLSSVHIGVASERVILLRTAYFAL